MTIRHIVQVYRAISGKLPHVPGHFSYDYTSDRTLGNIEQITSCPSKLYLFLWLFLHPTLGNYELIILCLSRLCESSRFCFPFQLFWHFGLLIAYGYILSLRVWYWYCLFAFLKPDRNCIFKKKVISYNKFSIINVPRIAIIKITYNFKGFVFYLLAFFTFFYTILMVLIF